MDKVSIFTILFLYLTFVRSANLYMYIEYVSVEIKRIS